MRHLMKMGCLVFSLLPFMCFAAEFSDWSADISHPYFSAWHPGFSCKLYGANPDTGITGWRQYNVQGDTILGDIHCLSVHFTNSAGGDYFFYIAQDTDGAIRYLKEGDTSFLSNPPIFFPADTSDGESWAIQYLTGRHSYSIAYQDTYEENGFGPYENSLYVRHYWDGALIGLIVVAPRFGYVHYNGQDLIEQNQAALSEVEGTVKDAWNEELIEGAFVWLDRDPPRQTSTDADGFYRFIDIPMRSYQFEVLKEKYQDYQASFTTYLNQNTVKNVDLIPLNGIVYGVVTDSNTALPIQNASVQIEEEAATLVKTDSEGKYRIENVRIGNHQVKAWGDVYNPDQKAVEVTEDEEIEVNFDLAPVYASLSGTLRNSLTRAPIGGGIVQIDGQGDTQVVTGADGAFLLPDIIPGTHYFQSWANGYLFYQKRVELEANQELNMGDVLLVAESTLLPAETDFYFDEGPEGWVFTSFPETYDVPEKTDKNGHLGLSAGGQTHCFGYWESPFIAFQSGKTYRATFILTSDQDSPENVPTARIRINSGNNQRIAFLSINSTGDGDSSPTKEPLACHLVFTPPVSASSQGFTINFDLANIGTGDNANAWIYLESVELEAVYVTPE